VIAGYKADLSASSFVQDDLEENFFNKTSRAQWVMFNCYDPDDIEPSQMRKIQDATIDANDTLDSITSACLALKSCCSTRLNILLMMKASELKKKSIEMMIEAVTI
jgi:hypothetical protein